MSHLCFLTEGPDPYLRWNILDGMSWKECPGRNILAATHMKSIACNVTSGSSKNINPSLMSPEVLFYGLCQLIFVLCLCINGLSF